MWRREYFWPSVLILIGIYFLLSNLHVLDRIHGEILWPLALIVLGGWLIVRRVRP